MRANIMASPKAWIGLFLGAVLALVFFIRVPYYFKPVLGERAADDPCRASQDGGKVKEYYPDGKPRSERDCKNGRTDGVLRQFYPDGTLLIEETYVSGKRHGLRQEYYPGGQPNRIMHFRSGRMDGIYRKFNQNGKVAYETLWRNDRQTSDILKEYKYYPNNNVKTEYIMQVEPGKSKGRAYFREFFENGRLSKEYVFTSRGRVSFYKEYDAAGTLVVDQRGGFTGVRKLFYDNGRLEKEERYEKGGLVEASDYDSYGQLQIRLRGGFLLGYNRSGEVVFEKDVKGWDVDRIAREYSDLEMNYVFQ